MIAVLMLGLAAVVGAEPGIEINYDYYGIAGQTADELREQMNIYGAEGANGKTYDAYTGWNVEWRYKYWMIEAGCSISTMEATLSVDFRLPRWTNYSDGPPGLKRKWDVYMHALRRHEDGHKNIGLAAAAEIEGSLAELEPAATCDVMAVKANNLARSILAKYAAKEKAYDARTNFGETQGAVFP